MELPDKRNPRTEANSSLGAESKKLVQKSRVAGQHGPYLARVVDMSAQKQYV